MLILEVMRHVLELTSANKHNLVQLIILLIRVRLALFMFRQVATQCVSFFFSHRNKYICTESHYTWIHTLWIMVLAPVLKVISVNKAWYDSYASFLTHLWHIYCLQHNRLCTKLKSMSSMLHFTASCDLLHFLCTLSHPNFRWKAALFLDNWHHKT